MHRTRRTPWVAILFTTLLAFGLIGFADLAALGGTTALLLLCVFTIVNVAVLVLRRDPVEHKHFRAPTALPVLGAVACAYLASPLSGRAAADYRIAGVLMVIGVGAVGGHVPDEPLRAAPGDDARPDQTTRSRAAI